MKIAIVDDDKKVYEHLLALLSELLDCPSGIVFFPDGEQFLSAWEKGAYDLIILDIFMQKLTGMDVARKIRETDPEARIVFCTTSNEFASESYEVNACYYLHKPFGRERVKAMLDRLNLAEVERLRTVVLPDGNSVVLSHILYADFGSHKTILHIKGDKDVIVRSPFSDIEPLLCAHPCFFSPCRGVVINLHEVRSQTQDTFTLSDGTRIPISRRRAKDVLEAYSSFRFDLMRKDGHS